jgi:hypothetical protein
MKKLAIWESWKQINVNMKIKINYEGMEWTCMTPDSV